MPAVSTVMSPVVTITMTMLSRPWTRRQYTYSSPLSLVLRAQLN